MPGGRLNIKTPTNGHLSLIAELLQLSQTTIWHSTATHAAAAYDSTQSVQTTMHMYCAHVNNKQLRSSLLFLQPKMPKPTANTVYTTKTDKPCKTYRCNTNDREKMDNVAHRPLYTKTQKHSTINNKRTCIYCTHTHIYELSYALLHIYTHQYVAISNDTLCTIYKTSLSTTSHNFCSVHK